MKIYLEILCLNKHGLSRFEVHGLRDIKFVLDEDCRLEVTANYKIALKQQLST